MKKIIFPMLLLTAFVFVSGVETKAQALKRIRFAKGKSSATVSGNTREYGMTYVISAKSGQKMTLTLSPNSKVGIKVIETDGRYIENVLLREERGGTYIIGLEKSTDYVIFIGSTNNKPVPFTLTVKITRMTDI